MYKSLIRSAVTGLMATTAMADDSPGTPYAPLVQAEVPAVYWRFAEPTFSEPGPLTPSVASNMGSAGAELDGLYRPGATPGLPGVPYTGIPTPNRATRFGLEVGVWIEVGGLRPFCFKETVNPHVNARTT
jgi:hypothetical protein